VKRSGSAATLISGTDGTGSSGNNGPPTAALLDSPTSLALAPNGDLYVPDDGDQVSGRITAP
jgi:serine/threonine-protein kinase